MNAHSICAAAHVVAFLSFLGSARAGEDYIATLQSLPLPPDIVGLIGFPDEDANGHGPLATASLETVPSDTVERIRVDRAYDHVTRTCAAEGSASVAAPFPLLPFPPEIDGLIGPKPSFLKGRNGHLALIHREAERRRLPPELADAVAHVESAYNPQAIGDLGEIGLMQIRAETAALLGYKGTVAALFDPETNVYYSVAYLAGAWRRAKGDLCRTLMKYRAGHGEERMSALSIEYCRRARNYLALTGSPLAEAPLPSIAAPSATARLAAPITGSGVVLPPRRPELGLPRLASADAVPKTSAEHLSEGPSGWARPGGPLTPPRRQLLGAGISAFDAPLPPRRPEAAGKLPSAAHVRLRRGISREDRLHANAPVTARQVAGPATSAFGEPLPPRRPEKVRVALPDQVALSAVHKASNPHLRERAMPRLGRDSELVAKPATGTQKPARVRAGSGSGFTAPLPPRRGEPKALRVASVGEAAPASARKYERTRAGAR